jgi:hypothetical protein
LGRANEWLLSWLRTPAGLWDSVTSCLHRIFTIF